jgi:hypothetical protein
MDVRPADAAKLSLNGPQTPLQINTLIEGRVEPQ